MHARLLIVAAALLLTAFAAMPAEARNPPCISGIGGTFCHVGAGVCSVDTVHSSGGDHHARAECSAGGQTCEARASVDPTVAIREGPDAYSAGASCSG